MKRELRKTEDKLVIDGIGVIIFDVWTVIKVMLLFWVNEYKPGTNPEEALNFIPLWALALVLLVLSGLIVSPRLYIGFSAIAEGKGKCKKSGYLFVAGLIITINIGMYIVAAVYQGMNLESFQLSADGILTMVIDLTSLAIPIEMIVSARKVRRLRNWAKE